MRQALLLPVVACAGIALIGYGLIWVGVTTVGYGLWKIGFRNDARVVSLS